MIQALDLPVTSRVSSVMTGASSVDRTMGETRVTADSRTSAFSFPHPETKAMVAPAKTKWRLRLGGNEGIMRIPDSITYGTAADIYSVGLHGLLP